MCAQPLQEPRAVQSAAGKGAPAGARFSDNSTIKPSACPDNLSDMTESRPYLCLGDIADTVTNI